MLIFLNRQLNRMVFRNYFNNISAISLSLCFRELLGLYFLLKTITDDNHFIEKRQIKIVLLII